MKNTEEPLIKTSDLNLASALLAVGNNIRAIDHTNPKRVSFYFDNTEEIVVVMKDYWDRTMMVSPLDLFDSRKQILVRMYEDEGIKKHHKDKPGDELQGEETLLP